MSLKSPQHSTSADYNSGPPSPPSPPNPDYLPASFEDRWRVYAGHAQRMLDWQGALVEHRRMTARGRDHAARRGRMP